MGKFENFKEKTKDIWSKQTNPQTNITYAAKFTRWLYKKFSRAFFLLVIGVGIPFGLYALLLPDLMTGIWHAFGNLLTGTHPKAGQPAALEWREAIQLLWPLMVAPSAFLLWYFRDQNVQGTLENQRKDVNLKEFQELQLRAAGALPENLPEHARETMQIAAMHQLRGYLRGEYGETFKRPAFELFMALQANDKHIQDGLKVAREWLESNEVKENSELISDGLEARFDAIRANFNHVTKARHQIIQEEFDAIFHSGFPLQLRSLQFLDISQKDLSDLDLKSCDFSGCRFFKCDLVNADLASCWLHGTSIFGCDLTDSQLGLVEFIGANISCTHMERANLQYANLIGSNFYIIGFNNAVLSLESFKNIHKLDCIYNEETNLVSTWWQLSKIEKDYLRLKFQTIGAYNAKHHPDYWNEIGSSETEFNKSKYREKSIEDFNRLNNDFPSDFHFINLFPQN